MCRRSTIILIFYMRHGSYPKDEIPPDDVRVRLTGKYEFTLRDQSGNVTHVEVPIAKAIWGSRGIYDLDKSELKLKKNTNYELQVRIRQVRFRRR